MPFNPVPKPISSKKKSKVSIWNAERKKLKEEFLSRGITSCEICVYEHHKGYALLSPGLGNTMLSFAHRHKRSWYTTQPHLLGDFHQVLLICALHHHIIEYNTELTQEYFSKIRGLEYL